MYKENQSVKGPIIAGTVIGAIMLYPVINEVATNLHNATLPKGNDSSQVEPAAPAGPRIINDTKIQLSNNLSATFNGPAANKAPTLGSVKLVTVVPNKSKPSQPKQR